MTNPRHQLTAVADLAAQLAHQWDTYLATIAAMAPPLLRAAGGDNARPSGHADPTPGTVLALDHHSDTVEAIAAWVAQGRWIADRVLGPIRAEGPRAAIAERDRRLALCADPLCGRYAVKAGHCLQHYNAAYYQTRRAAQKPPTNPPAAGDRSDHRSTSQHAPNQDVVDDSTETVLSNGSPHPCASTEGTCGRCGVKVQGVSVSHVHDLLAEHHASGCEVTL